MLVVSGCNAQSDKAKENAGSDVIRHFYEIHDAIWSSPPGNSLIRHKKLDSITEKYCTQRLRVKAKRWLADGHDLFTNDWDTSIATFGIVQEPNEENIFIVSFVVDAYDKPVKKKIRLRISVLKELGVYKLDSVTPLDE